MGAVQRQADKLRVGSGAYFTGRRRMEKRRAIGDDASGLPARPQRLRRVSEDADTRRARRLRLGAYEKNSQPKQHALGLCRRDRKRSLRGFSPCQRSNMNLKPMMKCGHRADITDPIAGGPLCSLCDGTKLDSRVLDDPIDLSKRRSRCVHYEECKHEAPSNQNLPYFEVRLMEDYDSYYCLCNWLYPHPEN